MARYVALGVESAFGTAVAATKYIDVKDADIGDDFTFGDQEGVADRHGIRKSEVQFKAGSGGWNMYIEAENGITRILEALMGQSASAVQGSGNLHTFDPLTDTTDKPSLTVRKGFDVDEEIHPGRMLESLEVTFDAGDYLMGRVETVGMESDLALAAIGTPTFATTKGLVARSGVLKIDAADVDVRSASVKIANAFETDDGVIAEDSYKRALKDTRLAVDGSISWQDFQTAERTKFKNGTISTLLLQGIGPQIGAGPEVETFELILDEIQYRELTWPMSGRDVRRMDTGFTALINAASGFSVQPSVINSEVSVV